MNEIQDNGIKIYTGETDDDDDDNPDIKELKARLYITNSYTSTCIVYSVCVCVWCRSSSVFALQEIIPFAVVGSNTLLEVNGKRVRGRLYPWGVVEGTS